MAISSNGGNGKPGDSNCQLNSLSRLTFLFNYKVYLLVSIEETANRLSANGKVPL